MSDLPDERWQTKTTCLKQGIQHIFTTKEFSDITFKVGKKSFRAHKLVLAARCATLASLLLEPNALIVDEHIVEEVTETGFEILLRFIYLDKLGTDDKASIVEAYLAAKHYQQKALMRKCEEMMLSWCITVEEVYMLLNVGLYIPPLKEKCLGFIKDNASEVIESSGFFKLNYNSLAAVLESDALESVEIMKRIDKIVEWGAKRHTEPVDYSLVREDFLSSKPPLLRLMGLEKLGLARFNLVVNMQYVGLLNPDELMCFLVFYAGQDVSVLPKWFNEN